MSRIPNPGAVQPGRRPAAAPPPQMPPPARPIPGITSGSPPLPIGRPVTMARSPQGTTAWVPAQATPALQSQLQAVQQEIGNDLAAGANTPPVDPSMPPTSLHVVDVNELPPQDRARQLQNINEAMTGAPARQQAQPQAQPRPAARPTARPPAAANPINSYANPQEQQAAVEQQVRQTGQAVVQQQGPALNEHAEKVLRGKQVPVEYGQPERPAPTGNFMPDPNFNVAQAPPPPQSYVPDPAVAAQEFRPAEPIAPMTNCPHCKWLLSMDDPVEPKYPEKLAYLQSVGGDKPYTQRVGLLGGHLSVAFRVLTTMEIDACFAQAQKDKKLGRIEDYNDYLEKVNRYRLFLQTTEVQTQTTHQMLPDGYTPESNPNATTFWDFGDTTPDEPLLAIEDWMVQNVLKTETMFRMLYQACGRFNQLVAKLEVMADTDSDFWNATAEQH